MDPGGSYDKTKVLDVKPLRCLAPMFPIPQNTASSSQSSSSPFISAPPFGPLPTGYTPYFPFYNPSDPPQAPIQNQYQQTPLDQTPKFQRNEGPPPQFVVLNSDEEYSNKKARVDSDGGSDAGTSNKKMRVDVDGGDSFKSPSPSIGEGISNGLVKKTKSNKRAKRSCVVVSSADGDSDSVWEIRMKYDALRRRISQLEDDKGTSSGNKRADLRAGTIMMNKGLRTNTRKRTGSVSGVEVGDIYFFRMEMCLVGLHTPSMAGIDYMIVKIDQEEETLATSVVSSGGYEDDVEDKDVLVYSGQGGGSKSTVKEIGDQKLERGNLALERSLRRGNEVRVIRGMKDLFSPTSKVYVYDGLYKIHESWTEKGKSGCNVFKYKFMRIPGQPEAFGIWKSVQQWRVNVNTRPGLILPDLTSGAEKIPVSLVNDIDDEKGPAHFTYSSTLKYSKPVSSMTPFVGCGCKGSCIPGDTNCSCVMKDGGVLPHTLNGVLVIRKHLIYECGPSCQCYSNCKNQVSQNGLKVQLEVFKTKDKGWGLRSWDPIRAGTFICEYTGQVIDRRKDDNSRDEDEEDDYLFTATRDFDNSFEWNYVPELLDEESPSDSNETSPPPISSTISAKHTGNVARFMNHSCSPNVFWQPVLYDHSDESSPHIMFYAMKHIPPMTELTYDYGLDGPQSRNMDRRKPCLCRSLKCRGYI